MADRLNEDWTVDVVARMHKYRITSAMLAEECNYAPAYISTLLNGRKEFMSDMSKERTKDVIYAALDRIVQRIEEEYAVQEDRDEQF